MSKEIIKESFKLIMSSSIAIIIMLAWVLIGRVVAAVIWNNTCSGLNDLGYFLAAWYGIPLYIIGYASRKP